MGQPNRREFVRAKVSFPAKIQILRGDDLELVKKGLGVTLLQGGDQFEPLEELIGTTPSSPQEEILYHCFKNFNSKLDFIIEQITLPAERRNEGFKEVVELSGSGFKFLNDEPMSKGNFVRAELIIPNTTQFRIEVIAEIIRSEPSSDSRDYLVAAKILEIDETSRDAIIESVFKKQRKLIRKQKALKEERNE